MVWQTGSGTQSNMNVNEVIANLANERLGDSGAARNRFIPTTTSIWANPRTTLFPTAMHIAAARESRSGFFRPCATSTRRFSESRGFRRHRQDRSHPSSGRDPGDTRTGILRLCRALELGMTRIEATLPGLRLAQGGTAVGTGLNAHRGFAERFAEEVAALTSLPFLSAPNKFEALASHDACSCSAHGALHALAAGCSRSPTTSGSWFGPRCGHRRISLPENEPGSSIMPGKVNPTQAEAMTMVCAQSSVTRPRSLSPICRAISSSTSISP